MKKTIFIVTGLCFTLAGFLSCKKVGVQEVIPESRQEIATLTFAGDYYIENSPASEYKIPVGTTTISNVPRTINFTYTSSTGAEQGVQYTAPASLTIPAGQARDTLRIKGIFAGYPSGRKDNLKVKLSGGDLSNFPGKDSFVLTLQKFCTVVLANIGGVYANTIEYTSSGAVSWGPYTTQVSNVVSAGTNKASGTVANIYDDGWNPVTINFDYTNPAAFKVSIPLQPTGRTYSGVDAYVRTSSAASAVNTFSSCENTITISIDIVTSTGAGFSGGASNYRVVLAR